MNLIEIFTVQQDIIKLQSGVISKLYLQLMQHVNAEEAGSLDCIADINQAAKLRAMLDKP